VDLRENAAQHPASRGPLGLRFNELMAVLTVIGCAALLRAEEPQAQPVDFVRDIQPIFA
jgi:hypothetical protein